ncbi:MAG: TonB-dependent receptor [Bacteroidota bacterium]
MRYILSYICLTVLWHTTLGQVQLNQTLSLPENNMSLEEVLAKIEESLTVEFSFVANDIDYTKKINPLSYATLEEHLKQILGNNFEFKVKGQKILIRKKGESSNQIVISGYIRDAETGEELIGATIMNARGNEGTVTNVYGFYSLKLPTGNHTLNCAYIGYKNLSVEINTSTDSTINFNLSSQDFLLNEVVIEADLHTSKVEEVEMSTNTLTAKKIEELPAFLGEADVIRSITLLPGVTTIGEGSPGFNVRGGDVDQNLVLLDEAPVYSSAHLLGFFSVFNADVIKDVKLYKGGIPSKYGGRISSVLDVRQKEGDMKAFHGKGGIGLVSSRLALEGPIVKDKSSFIIAGRRTYADILYRAVTPSDEEAAVYFYDLNAKVNYKINDKNRLFLSGYLGNDVAAFDDDVRFRWGNGTGTLRWTNVLSSNLFFNTSFIYSRYTYELGIEDEPEDFLWKSQISNYHIKPEFTWYLNENNTLEFGGRATLFQFKPGEVDVNDVETESFIIPNEKALELGIYAGNEQKIGEKMILRYGLRYSRYHFLGPLDVYTYASDELRDEDNIIDTTSYKNNEIISTFDGFEPRFSAAYQLNAKSTIKTSYQRMYQYQQLVSNTTNATPFDVWKSAGPHVKPLISDQIALGYVRNFMKNKLEASIEFYYKVMDNLIDYKNGANLLLTENIETELLTGNGRAYGAEFMLEKKRGKLNGWFSYTLSRVERQVKGNTPQSSINNGKYYLSDYDKTHDLSLVLSYVASKRWQLNMNFLYATGRPATYPDARYEFEGVILPNYSSRNNERLPDYHRLDFSATLKNRIRPNRSWRSSWTFSIYNVYARKNVFSIFFRPDDDRSNTLNTKAKQLSILGTVFPAVTYNFEF